MAECRAILLDDTPSSVDAFSSGEAEGPHKRVARAVIEMIEEETGGKVVGLEGDWGSGKSTVVNLVTQHFEGQDQTTIVSFDAWAHEGDPLRRSYLERVIRELQIRGWVDKKSWQKKLKLIAHRKRNTESTTTTQPTVFGQILALAAVAVPFGTSLVTDALRGGVTIDSDAPFAIQFLIGATLSLAPLLVLLGNVLFAFAVRRPISWKLLSQNEVKSLTTTTELPNPTSIEFEGFFADLLQEALDDKKPDRRLVLVVDNLDRVDSANALSIWATLQTFLQDRRLRAEGWFGRVWIIVPFDPRGLRKLWDRQPVRADDDDERDLQADTEVSDSFFDKSFQIRFYIAPPVISDWRAFLDDRLKEALPDHNQDDRYRVYRAYEHCTRHRVDPPTPRGLKLFVNQIVAVVRQWGKEFPLDHVAYFVLERRQTPRLIEKLRSGGIPHADDSRLFDRGSLTDSVSGLVFNVRPGKGRQLLLGEPIRHALFEDGDLREIAEGHPEGFWPVFDTVVNTELIGATAQHVARAAVKLDESKLLEEDHYEVKTITESVRKAVTGIGAVEPWNESMAEGVAALCRLLRDKTQSARLFEAVGNVLAKQTKPAIEPEVMVSTLTTIFDVADKIGHQESLPAEIQLLLDAEGWRRACVALSNDAARRQRWKRLRPTMQFSELSEYLATRATEGQFVDEDAVTISVTSRSAFDPQWDKLAAVLKQRLETQQNPGQPQIYPMLASLWNMRRGSQGATNALQQLVAQGHLANHLHSMRKNGQYRALCVFTSLTFIPDASEPAAVGNSQAGHQFISQLLESPPAGLAEQLVLLANNLDMFHWPLDVVEARPQCDSLIAQCLKLAARSEHVKRFYPVQRFLKQWRLIGQAVQDDQSPELFESLIRALDAEKELSSAVSSEDFAAGDAELYLWIAKQHEKESPFLSWCRRELEAAAKGLWVSDLKGAVSCSRLANELHSKGASPVLSTDFSDAVEDYARHVSGGNEVPEVLVDLWPSLMDCLPAGIRKSVRDRILNIAESRNGKFGKDFFSLFGAEIAEAERYGTRNTVSEVFVPLFREKTAPGLTWLRERLEADSQMIKHAKSDADFITRLQTHVDEEREEATEIDNLISAIARALGVSPTPKPELDDANGDVGSGDQAHKTEQS